MSALEPAAPPHPADTPPPVRDTGSLGAPAVPTAAMASQSTAIEATRAVAEVQALVGAARMFPRIPDEAIVRMQEACGRPEVIADAFYSFRRGKGPDSQVHGPTVQLMRVLAGCWGNVTHGFRELYRDDLNGRSEMQAWAWDLELNHRVERNVIVPHRRDKGGQRVELTQDRDVTENNANRAARAEREMISQVLPAWFRAQAVELCERGVQGDPTVPMPMRIANVVAFFGDTYGIKPDQLEGWIDAPRNSWTVFDLARLSALKGSLHRNETTIAAEFTAERVTADEIRLQAAAQPAVTGAEAPPAANPEGVGSYAPDDPERPM